MTHIIKHSTIFKNGRYNLWDNASETIIIIVLSIPIKETDEWSLGQFIGRLKFKVVCLTDYIEDLYNPSQTELLLLQLEHDIVFVNDIKKPINYQPTNPNFRKESWRKNK